MSDELWQNMIVSFLSAKREDDLIKLYKEALKQGAKIYDKHKALAEELKDLFEGDALKKPKEILEVEFYSARVQALQALCVEDSGLSVELLSLYSELLSPLGGKAEEISKKYESNTWINLAAQKAQSVSFATHVAKLTHSKIPSPSIFDQIKQANDRYLTTSTIADPVVDGAVAGNQFAPIFQFLSLEVKDQTLAKQFLSDSNEILLPFARDPQQHQAWNLAFKKALQTDQLSTHSLAKQVYFPIQGKHAYHLLVQMVSSSMAHAIFGIMYTDSAKSTRDQCYNKRFSDDFFINFPEKAALSVTASNHSNASQLNGKRGGKLYLFNAQPPTWTAQKNPPRKKSYFYEPQLAYRSSEAVREMSEMLVTFEKAAISYREPRRLRGILNWCRDIASDAIHFASQIQQLPAGWSADPSLKLDEAHQFFLDLNRQDSDFKQKRQSSDWQKEITKDFAKWLNAALKKASKDQFTPQLEHSKLWQAVFAEELRIYLDACKGYEYEIKQVRDAGGAV